MDYISMWIDGEYDELFTNLRTLEPEDRRIAIRIMLAEMREFDRLNDGAEAARFIHEIISRF